MSDLADRLSRARARIAAAAARAGRAADDVALVAISKTFPAARVVEAVDCGLHRLGENRVQEAAAKIPEVDAARGAQEWHLVGALQRNKARKAVELFTVIESVDRPELARALDRAAADLGKRPRVLLQVNVDDEPQKAGVTPDEAGSLLQAIDACEHLDAVGLMAIPRAHPDPEQMRPAFARLRALRDALDPSGERLPELSMGMTADFEVAIEEGATWIRLGTALFGERAR